MNPNVAWPLGLTLGLSLGVGGTLTMVSVAVRNPSAPAAERPYEAAADYNHVFAERQAARALGWTVRRAAGSGAANVLRLDVKGPEGEPIPGLAGQVEIRRGDQTADDRTVDLLPTEAGQYAATFDGIRPGFYDVSIRLEGGPAPWVGARRVWLGAAGETP